MSRDPIVDEIRAIRAAIAQEHGNDLKAIVAALKRREGADGRRVVSLAVAGTPRTPATRKAGRRRPDGRSHTPAARTVKRRHV
jgi:hypothetical protein